jgi:hypothetical protein
MQCRRASQHSILYRVATIQLTAKDVYRKGLHHRTWLSASLCGRQHIASRIPRACPSSRKSSRISSKTIVWLNIIWLSKIDPQRTGGVVCSGEGEGRIIGCDAPPKSAFTLESSHIHIHADNHVASFRNSTLKSTSRSSSSIPITPTT